MSQLKVNTIRHTGASSDAITLAADGKATYAATSGTSNFTISDGNLVIGTNGHGIDFSATTDAGGMTSELLDDYERGTFTPTDASGGSLSFTVNSASYVKVGDLVHVNMYIHYPSTSDTNTALIGGLPYSQKASNNYSFLVGKANGMADAATGQINTGGNYFYVMEGITFMTNANLSGDYVLFSGTYTTA